MCTRNCRTVEVLTSFLYNLLIDVYTPHITLPLYHEECVYWYSLESNSLIILTVRDVECIFYFRVEIRHYRRVPTVSIDLLKGVHTYLVTIRDDRTDGQDKSFLKVIKSYK